MSDVDDGSRGGMEEPGAALSKEAAADIRVVARGGAVQIVGQITQRSLSFFFAAVFVRLLDKASYGLYRLVIQILSNASQLGLAGFNYASMRWGARARGTGERGGIKGAATVGLSGAAMMSALVVVALLAVAEPVASVFSKTPAEEDEIVDLLRIGIAYIPLFALMQVLRYVTQAYKTMVPSVVVGNIVQPVARFILAVGALIAFESVSSALVALNISIALSVFLAVWYVVKMMGPDELRAPGRRYVGEMVRFAFPQAGASLLGVQTLGLGLLVLGHYKGNNEVGAFAIALALQGPGNVFLGGIVNIWAPVVADLHGKGEIARLGSLYQTINRWIATFSFPVFGALLIMPGVFVDYFAGREGVGVASVVAVLAIGNIFYTGTGPTGYIISMTGHPGVNFANSVVGVLLYIGLGAWIVPEHGALGMAAVDSIVTALINSARVVQAKILVGVQPFGRTFYKPVVATLVGALFLLLWKFIPGHALIFDTAGICLAAGVYLLVLRYLGIDEEERHVLERIKKRAFRRKASG